MSFIDTVAAQAAAWVANPVPSLVAFLIGCSIGFFVSKMRHQGKIDALDERLKNKADQIETKDKAIQALSDELKALKDKIPAPQSAPAILTEAAPKHGPSLSDQFWQTNQQITRATEERILQAVARTTYKFIFNPAADLSKILTFLPNGTIGQGRNANENRWRVRAGQLEILSARHEVYSRFNLLEDGLSFHHTNEPGLPSIRGQYMHPIAVIPESPDLRG